VGGNDSPGEREHEKSVCGRKRAESKNAGRKPEVFVTRTVRGESRTEARGRPFADCARDRRCQRGSKMGKNNSLAEKAFAVNNEN